MSDNKESKPWYRHPFVWLVIFFPLSAVVGGIHLLFIANEDPNDVVKDNYYKEGLAINQRLAEDELAREMNLQALVNTANGSLKVTLTGPEQPFLQFSLYHVKDSDQDISGALALVKKGGQQSEYVYQFNKEPVGRWYIEIKGDNGNEQSQWRLKGRLDMPLSGDVTLLPAKG